MEKKLEAERLKQLVKEQEQKHKQFNLYRIVSQKQRYKSPLPSQPRYKSPLSTHSVSRAVSRESDKRNLAEYLSSSKTLNHHHQENIYQIG